MKKIWLIALLVSLLFAGVASAAQVTLAWDANDPPVDGYKLFTRTGGVYNYDTPVWTGTDTTCTVTVPDNLQSAFVVRAFRILNLDGSTQESGDSNEVIFTPASLVDPPAPPANLLIQAVDQIIQGLNTLKEAVAAYVPHS